MKKTRKQAPVQALEIPTPAPRSIPRWAAPLIVALCVLVFYWTPLTSASASIQWDAADMHYPFQKYFSERLFSGDLPFWTPYLFGGFPFLANPETAAWYLPHWSFYLAGVTPRAIQAELALHAVLACLGTFLLLRKHGVVDGAAALGAFAFGFSGFFAGHSSHIGLFAAASWLPWLLLAYRCAMDSAYMARYVAMGALAGGLMILAGYVQTAMYGFLCLALYAAADLPKMRAVVSVAGMLVGAVAVAAVQILPALELTDLSIRAGQEYSKSTEGVLTPGSLSTLVLPDALGAFGESYKGPADVTQHYFYAGLLLLPLAVLGAWKSKMRVIGLLVLIPAVWYMLGPGGGLYHIGAVIPLLHKVRAPVQGWFVAAMGLAILAAAGADYIFRRWSVRWLSVAVVAVLFVDVWYNNSIINPLAWAREGFEQLYGAQLDTARERLASTQPPLTRFDAPRAISAFGPLDHPLLLKLETTYGYGSLEPRIFNEYAAVMTRNSKLRDGVNVSRVLNMQMGGVEAVNTALPRAYFPRSVVAAPSEAESLKMLETLDPAATGVVLGLSQQVQQDTNAQASVMAHTERSYRVRYSAASPSLLKLAVSWYPGWRATLNGRELPVLRVDHALMGVVAPAGQGEVEFRFESQRFATGLAISAVAAIGLIAVAALTGRKKLLQPSPADAG